MSFLVIPTIASSNPPPTPAPPASDPADAERAYQASIAAYQKAIAKMSPLTAALPLAPYPPSNDSSSFPRTGSPKLLVRTDSVTAAQRAEPGLITKNLLDQAAARRPHLNAAFFVGAACLAGYFLLRR